MMSGPRAKASAARGPAPCYTNLLQVQLAAMAGSCYTASSAGVFQSRIFLG